MSKSQRYRYRPGWYLSPQYGPSLALVATHHTHSRDETIGIKIRHESTQSCVTSVPIDLLVRLKTAIFICGYSHFGGVLESLHLANRAGRFVLDVPGTKELTYPSRDPWRQAGSRRSMW